MAMHWLMTDTERHPRALPDADPGGRSTPSCHAAHDGRIDGDNATFDSYRSGRLTGVRERRISVGMRILTQKGDGV